MRDSVLYLVSKKSQERELSFEWKVQDEANGWRIPVTSSRVVDCVRQNHSDDDDDNDHDHDHDHDGDGDDDDSAWPFPLLCSQLLSSSLNSCLSSLLSVDILVSRVDWKKSIELMLSWASYFDKRDDCWCWRNWLYVCDRAISSLQNRWQWSFHKYSLHYK